MLKKVLKIGGGISLAYLIAFGILVLRDNFHQTSFGSEITDDRKLKTTEDKIIDYKEIDDYVCDDKNQNCVKGERMVVYTYLDSELMNEENEDISKRTSNGRFFKMGVKDGQEHWSARFSIGDKYKQKDEKWYEVKSARTTLEAYQKQLSFFGKIKFNMTALAYSVGAGDSRLQKDNSSLWPTTWQSATSNYTDGAFDAGTKEYAGVGMTGSNYIIQRANFPIDTSAIPDNATVTSSTFVFKVYAVDDGINDAYSYLALVWCKLASTANTVATDYVYSKWGTTSFGSIDLTNIAANSFNTWTINAEGLGHISTTGTTELGFREGHDVEYNSSGISSGIYSGLVTGGWDSSEGTNPPILNIDYTVPETPSGTQKSKANILIFE